MRRSCAVREHCLFTGSSRELPGRRQVVVLWLSGDLRTTRPSASATLAASASAASAGYSSSRSSQITSRDRYSWAGPLGSAEEPDARVRADRSRFEVTACAATPSLASDSDPVAVGGCGRPRCRCKVRGPLTAYQDTGVKDVEHLADLEPADAVTLTVTV